MFHWKMMSEEELSSKKVLPAPMLWATARLLIEDHVRVHGKTRKAHVQRCYLEASRWCPINGKTEKLIASSVIKPDDVIAVKRRPVDYKLYDKCNKRRKTKEEWEQMAEDERLDHVLSMDFYDMVYVGDLVEEQVILTNEPRRGQSTLEEHLTLDTSLVCTCCGRVGHLARGCPRVGKRGFVPLNKRKKPVGIPKTMLKRATEAEYDSAFIGDDGKLWVVK